MKTSVSRPLFTLLFIAVAAAVFAPAAAFAADNYSVSTSNATVTNRPPPPPPPPPRRPTVVVAVRG